MHLIAAFTGLLGSVALVAAAPLPTTAPLDVTAPLATSEPMVHASSHPRPSTPVCAIAPGPEYYAFELYTTRNIPGTGLAKGLAEVSRSGSSPFSVALGPDGSYVYDVDVSIDRMKVPRQGRLVAWVTTPDIDRIERMSVLDEDLRAAGSVSWNKFIVVITLEPEDDPSATTWSGPVVFRGMSRSGMMHTMVGHGALQQENCAAYGYGN